MTQSFLCPTFRSLHIAFIAFQNCSCLFSEIPIEAERIHCDMDPTVQSGCPLSRSKGPMLHLWVQDLPGYLGSCSMLFGPTGATWCNMVQRLKWGHDVRSHRSWNYCAASIEILQETSGNQEETNRKPCITKSLVNWSLQWTPTPGDLWFCRATQQYQDDESHHHQGDPV